MTVNNVGDPREQSSLNLSQELLGVIQTVLKIKQDHPDDAEARQQQLMKMGIDMVAKGVQGLLDLEKPMLSQDDKVCKILKANADRRREELFPTGAPVLTADAVQSMEQAKPEQRKWVPLPFWFNPGRGCTGAQPLPQTECQCVAEPKEMSDDEFVQALGNYQQFPHPKSPGALWLMEQHLRLINDYPGPVNMAMIKAMVTNNDKAALWCVFHQGGTGSLGEPVVDDELATATLLFMIKRNKLELVKQWFQMRDASTFHKHVTQNRSKALRRAIDSANLKMLRFLLMVGQCTDYDVRDHDGLLLRRAALYDDAMCRWLCETYDLRGADVRVRNFRALKHAKDNDNIELLWYLAKRT